MAAPFDHAAFQQALANVKMAKGHQLLALVDNIDSKVMERVKDISEGLDVCFGLRGCCSDVVKLYMEQYGTRYELSGLKTELIYDPQDQCKYIEISKKK